MLRGANPATLTPPSVHEQRDVLAEHFRLAVDLHGEQLAGRNMRKFAIKYARLHPEALTVRDAFIAAKTTADWQMALTRHYATDAAG